MIGHARVALIGVLALILGACTDGKEFALPAQGVLVLGQTTPDEIIAGMGQPAQRATTTTAEASDTSPAADSVFTPAREAGRYERFAYFNGDKLAINAQGVYMELFQHAIRRTRSFSCTFWNGKLVQYASSSSFPADKTDFDDSKIASLVRGKSTGDDVLALFGKPTGGAIYPIISRPDGAALVYLFEEENIDERARRVKVLEIFVDQGGIVREFRSNIGTVPFDVSPGAPAAPIFVPTGR
jgi:hypothetical protein